MKFVMLVGGKMRSGKNTFGSMVRDHLVQLNQSVSEDMFARGVKDGCREDFKNLGKSLDKFYDKIINLFNSSHDKYEDLVQLLSEYRLHDDVWYENKNDISRCLLQTYGTDIFVNRVNNRYWVNQVIDRIRSSNDTFHIITDTRYPVEIAALKEQSDFYVATIYIERENNTGGFNMQHPSETSLDRTDFDIVIQNQDGLIDLLKNEAIFCAEAAVIYVDKCNNSNS